MAISYQKEKKCWRAYFFYRRKQFLIGTFKDKIHAELAFLMWKDFFIEKKMKVCKGCDKTFLPVRSDQIYCGSFSAKTGCSVSTLKIRRKRFYSLNKDKIKTQQKNYYLQHKDVFEAKGRRYRNRKFAAEGFHSNQEWELLKKQYAYRCAHCKQSALLTRDHIIPLSKGGSDNIVNIQPLCKPCNSAKRDKLTQPVQDRRSMLLLL